MINFNTRLNTPYPYKPLPQPAPPTDSGKGEGQPHQLWRSEEDRKAYIDRGGKYADLIGNDVYTWGFRDGKIFKV